MSETPEQAHISKVHLKGYKSIRDLEIDFMPGLNIIIGPNGSGKTNFLESIEGVRERNIRIPNFESLIQFQGNNSKHKLFYKTEYAKVDKIAGKNLKISYELKIDNETITKDIFLIVNRSIYSLESLNQYHPYWTLSDFQVLYLKYGVDTKFLNYGLNQPWSIEVFNDLKKNHVNQNKIENPFWGQLISQMLDSKEILSPISDNFKYFDFSNHLVESLKKFTPIQNILFDTKKMKVYEQEGLLIFDNINLLFEINNDLFYWNQLSDGTKRILFIVLNIYNSKKQILLEEPELGIHPDQLHKLMDFLIEQSKEKQIIITTHSPEVLNAIHPDELDRIIVTRYDAEKGTIMRKLSPEQAKEMGERIKQGDMFLSDRWVHLNLEDEIFNAA